MIPEDPVDDTVDDASDVATLRAELAEVRAQSAERWAAIGRLAPAAKVQRDRAEEARRLLVEVREVLAQPLDEAARAALLARIDGWLAR